MKFNKLITALSISLLTITGCNSKGDNKKTEDNKIVDTVEVDLTNKTKEQLISIEKLQLEVDEQYNFKKLLTENPTNINNYSFVIGNPAKLEMSALDSNNNIYAKGLEVGNLNLYVFYENTNTGKTFYQKLEVNVFEKGGLSADYTFDYGRLAGKNVVIFGDSVTVGAGVSTNKRYWELLRDELEFKGVKSFAVGGTTMTYMYDGSHIKNEYYSGFGRHFNGTSFITVPTTQEKVNNYTSNEDKLTASAIGNEARIKATDYLIIFYGHNDMYFQVPIGTTEYLPKNLNQCTTFKASYAYALNYIKSVNPDVRILLLAPQYSEYAPNASYNKNITYADYRNAIKDMAAYYKVKCIDLWDESAVANQSEPILQDAVHPNNYGHRVIADIIKKH